MKHIITFGRPVIDIKTGKEPTWCVTHISVSVPDEIVTIILEKYKSIEVKKITMDVNQAQDIGFINLSTLNSVLETDDNTKIAV